MDKRKNISEIDENLKVENNIGKEDVRFYNPLQTPFSIHGLMYEDGGYARMKKEVAAQVSEGVQTLYTNTAGGRIRFKTNSQYVAIKVRMPSATLMAHMAFTGSSGFDLYIGNIFYKTFAPPVPMTDGYDGIIEFPDCRMREIMINFPLYNDVSDVFIGLQETAAVEAPVPYGTKKPVVYYGSSITQGGCASRPGNSYQAIISRMLDCDYINLGFSGSAKGELEMARYIASLDMSVFVCDYDYNAPDEEHLRDTHRRLYLTVRESKPDLPIIFVSKPDFEKVFNEADQLASIMRRNVVYETYIEAVKNGDANVYFVDGRSLFAGAERDCCTVDGCHPNDLGFWKMSQVIGEAVRRCI